LRIMENLCDVVSHIKTNFKNYNLMINT